MARIKCFQGFLRLGKDPGSLNCGSPARVSKVLVRTYRHSHTTLQDIYSETPPSTTTTIICVGALLYKVLSWNYEEPMNTMVSVA